MKINEIDCMTGGIEPLHGPSNIKSLASLSQLLIIRDGKNAMHRYVYHHPSNLVAYDDFHVFE